MVVYKIFFVYLLHAHFLYLFFFTRGLGHLPEARQLAKHIDDRLGQLNSKVAKVLTMNVAPQALEAKLEKVFVEITENNRCCFFAKLEVICLNHVTT